MTPRTSMRASTPRPCTTPLSARSNRTRAGRGATSTKRSLTSEGQRTRKIRPIRNVRSVTASLGVSARQRRHALCLLAAASAAQLRVFVAFEREMKRTGGPGIIGFELAGSSERAREILDTWGPQGRAAARSPYSLTTSTRRPTARFKRSPAMPAAMGSRTGADSSWPAPECRWAGASSRPRRSTM